MICTHFVTDLSRMRPQYFPKFLYCVRSLFLQSAGRCWCWGRIFPGFSPDFFRICPGFVSYSSRINPWFLKDRQRSINLKRNCLYHFVTDFSRICPKYCSIKPSLTVLLLITGFGLNMFRFCPGFSQDSSRIRCGFVRDFPLIFIPALSWTYSWFVPDSTLIHSRFVPNLGRIWPEIGLKFARNWSRFCPQLIQIWPEIIPEFGQDLGRFSTDNVLNLSWLGSEFVPNLSRIFPKFNQDSFQICPGFVPSVVL